MTSKVGGVKVVFFYNQASSIVSEEEERRERGQREILTEPFPELPDWEWTEDMAMDKEEGDQVQEPAAAVPDEEELSDYEHYEQIEQEENENMERDAEDDPQDVQAQQPFTATVDPEDDLPDYEYYEQLDEEMETEAESFIQQDTQPSDAELYRSISAIDQTLSPSSSADISGVSMTHDTKENPTNMLPRSSSHSSLPLDRPYYPASQKLIGQRKVRKPQRVDRMIWNKVMQKKMAHLIKVCEKYVPVDVLKGLQLGH